MRKSGEKRFPHIFQEWHMGTFKTRNRVKYASCSIDGYCDRDGMMTIKELARMRDVARTGCSVITNQGAFIDSGASRYIPRQLGICDDKHIPGLKQVADLVHEQGAIAIQQIMHAGRYGGVDVGYCVQPSSVPQTLPHFRPPRGLTKDQIKKIVRDHAEAARRAMQAGYDGVELPAFMGYLIAEFNSKFTNRRKDEYGGDIYRRARFMIEVIQAVRDVIGNDRLIIIRLPGTELMNDFPEDVGEGNSDEECLEVIKIAAQTGVDCISITVGWQESRQSSIGRDIPAGHWLYLAENAKKVVQEVNPDVVVAFGPRMGSDAALAEKALAEGKFDFWEICRPMLADPEMLVKISEGRSEDIRFCIACNTCVARMFYNQPYLCAVNPRLGHEAEPLYDIKPTPRKKSVLVVGGGPAGSECAITAAMRGHQVTLCEKEGRIGGQVLAQAKEMANQELMRLVEYYETQLAKSGIEVRLNTEIRPEFFAKLSVYDRYDVVVIATGADIELPSSDSKNNLVSAIDVLQGKAEVGRRVAVLGGGKVGLTAAEYLARSGRQVYVVEESRQLAEDVLVAWRWRHKAWVRQLGIEALTSTRVKEIGEDGVTVVDEAGNETFIAVDTAVVAAPRKSRQELVEPLLRDLVVDELYVIGDAESPLFLFNATRSGFRTGAAI